ncbi:MAG: GNAT family N-acetyltransferase [Anaerolineae bacterium]|nr:GNAT family N-acetyltransferase [Anaerolineae bacterium]
MLQRNIPGKRGHIRPLDSNRDLNPVADLIEVCFASTLDQDGRDYLRHIRMTAADPALIRWLPGLGERASSPLFGYVWEQDNRLVGNLSLIPIKKNGRWIYMIANVAVHPDYRRRGIAYELTRHALDHVRARGVPSAWLQVRDDNFSAYELYTSVGFIERSRRSTWVSGHTNLGFSPTGIHITQRIPQDWTLQRAWLTHNYPPDTTWNMSFDINRYRPDWWNQFWYWLNGELQLHWVARRANGSHDTLGFATWEPVRGSTDMLWIGAPPESEDSVLCTLLPHIVHAMRDRRRPIAVNYPYGHGVSSFLDCGFTLQNTLVWMEYPCN